MPRRVIVLAGKAVTPMGPRGPFGAEGTSTGVLGVTGAVGLGSVFFTSEGFTGIGFDTVTRVPLSSFKDSWSDRIDASKAAAQHFDVDARHKYLSTSQVVRFLVIASSQ